MRKTCKELRVLRLRNRCNYRKRISLAPIWDPREGGRGSFTRRILIVLPSNPERVGISFPTRIVEVDGSLDARGQVRSKST